MRRGGIPVAEGFSERQIALGLGMPTRWVSEVLLEPQDELRRLG